MKITPAMVSGRIPDIIAGLSIAGLLLPEAVAYSGIGNLPPQAGVIALFAGLLVYALLGRSRFAIVSATSSSAALMAASIGVLAGSDLQLRIVMSAALVILAGAVFMAASAAKLGSATDFIAKPVLRGFAFGLATVIIIKQLPVLLGVPAGGDIGQVIGILIAKRALINEYDLLIGGVALALLFLFGRNKKIPGALIVIALGIFVNQAFSLSSRVGIEVVGDIRLDSVALRMPVLDRNQWRELGELALAMVLIIYAESSGSIRSFAVKHGDQTYPNRDLFALGVANVVSGLLQGMPVGAGYSATSANEEAGAQSRLSGLVAAAAVLVLILLVLSWIALTPAAILAAIVIHAVSHTLNPIVFRPYFVWRRDRVVAICAVLAVLVFGVLDGLLAAVGVSIAMMLRGLAQSRVAVLGRHSNGHDFVDCAIHPEATRIPDVLVLRPESPVFFANVDRIFAHIREQFTVSVASVAAWGAQNATPAAHSAPVGRVPMQTLVVSLEETPDLDGTTLEALHGLAVDIRAAGGRLFLARLKQPVLDALGVAKIEELPSSSIAFFSVDDAVTAALGAQF